MSRYNQFNSHNNSIYQASNQHQGGTYQTRTLPDRKKQQQPPSATVNDIPVHYERQHHHHHHSSHHQHHGGGTVRSSKGLMRNDTVRASDVPVGSKFWRGGPIDFLVEKQKPSWNCWLITLLVVFLVLLAIVVLSLIAFFVSGAASGRRQYLTISRTQRFRAHAGHYDLINVDRLYGDMSEGRRVCLLEIGQTSKSVRSFDRGHIAGARLLDVAQLVDSSGQLLHPVAFTSMARGLGLDEHCHIVVYDGGTSANPLLSAYAWWVFKVTPTTAENTGTPKRGDFLAAWNPDNYISKEDIIKAMDTGFAQIIDVRTSSERTNSNRDGSLPGAISIPWSLLHDGVKVQNFNIIKEIIKDVGLEPHKRTIIFGANEASAALMQFLLTQISDYESAQIYPAGWNGWNWNADAGDN